MLTDSSIKSHIYSAMLYNIPEPLKRLSFEVCDGEIHLLAICEVEPMVYVRDCIYSIMSEVTGKYPQPEVPNKVTFTVEKLTREVPDLKHLVYAKYEADTY